MTRPEFHAAIKSLGLTYREFARITGISRTTAEGWGRVRGGNMQEFPGWVRPLLDAWSGGGIPRERDVERDAA